MSRWSVAIEDFHGGFAPAWYKETYPSYGNKNHAGAMQNIDLTNPGGFTQGPGLANLTNGTQAAAVTTLINSIVDEAVASDTTYGVGGAKLYQISSTAVANSGSWPHTIDKATVTGETGEDVVEYQGALYYSYNHSGSAGDIGKYDLSSTFDDDWGSTVPSGMAALQDAPHQMVHAGNDTLYIANGLYVASWDGTTFIPQALDLPTGSVVQSIQWNSDRLWIAANDPDISGSNKNTGSIYIWDGTTNSWEAEIRVNGALGGMHVKNGVLFAFYKDLSSTGGFKLAYVSGGSLVDIANFTGALPTYSQISDYKDFIIWNSNGLIFAFGAGDKDLPVKMFQLADGGYATVGALSTPFGTPMVASWDASTNYKLAQFSGYDTACYWKSLVFDVTGETGHSQINNVIINFDSLGSGARVDWKLLDSQGNTLYSDTISAVKAAVGGPKHTYTNATYNLNGIIAENFRIEFDFTNGSTSNPVVIRNAKIYGTSGE